MAMSIKEHVDTIFAQFKREEISGTYAFEVLDKVKEEICSADSRGK